jgi:prepilin-type N-terminal cleavage/methylation domain-containing protein
MTKKKLAAFTLVEMLVVISIIAVIAALAFPAISGALVRSQMTQAVSNARQIYLATFSMVNDGSTTGDARYGWPGDLATSTDPTVVVTTVSDFVQRLVDHDYLKSGDLKVFATSGITPWNGKYTAPADAKSKGALIPAFDATQNSAFKVYKVTDKDAGNVIFLATKNFTYADAQTTALDDKKKPFGEKGFVIFHKGGDGIAFKKQQATAKQLLGVLPGQGDTGANPDETADAILTQQ